MRYYCFGLLLFCCSCRKEAAPLIFGKVVVMGTYGNNCLVEFQVNDQTRPDFLCTGLQSPPTGTYNCSNAFYITNLPADLQPVGTEIQFSAYQNKGRNPVWSSTTAAIDLEVYDARVRQ